MLSQPSHPDIGYVTYEIHLHPTYRLPCLWFSLHNLPDDEVAFNIDTVFRRLVPDAYKSGLRRGIGGIGGISADVSNVVSLLPLPFRSTWACANALTSPVAPPNHRNSYFLHPSLPSRRRDI